MLQQLVQSFWRRWSQEYLHQLQQRNKWKQQMQPITPGLLVIIKEDHTKPMTWPMGRIVEVHPGKDDVIRVVTIKTLKGLIKRTLTSLYILPIQC